MQFTLVDCPGHASLIRTVMAGACIIDCVLLVIDAKKGIQSQTTECLVLGDVLAKSRFPSPTSLIVLNKVDLLVGGKSGKEYESIVKQITRRVAGTAFAHCPIVALSARPGGGHAIDSKAAKRGDDAATATTAAAATTATGATGVEALVEEIIRTVVVPPERVSTVALPSCPSPSFLFAIDHCFPIKGQGTVITGTCLAGYLRPNDVLSFPELGRGFVKKVKSCQVFHKTASIVKAGDRAGLCITGLDSNSLERSIAASEGGVVRLTSAIVSVKRVKFYDGGEAGLLSGRKFHVSVGYRTVMATATFFGGKEIAMQRRAKLTAEGGGVVPMTTTTTMTSIAERLLVASAAGLSGESGMGAGGGETFDFTGDFEVQRAYADDVSTLLLTDDELAAREASASVQTGGDSSEEEEEGGGGTAKRRTQPLDAQFAILHFEEAVSCPVNSMIIGSRLDSEDISCRLAFYGRLLEVNHQPSVGVAAGKADVDDFFDHKIRFFSMKSKSCIVVKLGEQFLRESDGKQVVFDVIGKDLFGEGTNLSAFTGLKLQSKGGEVGVISGSFSTDGRFRVDFPGGLSKASVGNVLTLSFKKFRFDESHKMVQSHIVVPPPAARKAVVKEPKEPKKPKPIADKAHSSAPSSSGGSLAGNPSKKGGKDEKDGKAVTAASCGGASTISEAAAATATTATPTATQPSKDAASQLSATRAGEIEKFKGEGVYIVHGMFLPEEDIRPFVGKRVVVKTDSTPTGAVVHGEILGPFGKAGKCKISVVSDPQRVLPHHTGGSSEVSELTTSINELAVGLKVETLQEGGK